MAGKVPVLRQGLTLEELKKGSWVCEPNRYTSEYEDREASDKIIEIALQSLIDRANKGERVHRKCVKQTLNGAAECLKALASTIPERMGKGELLPGILDEIANS